MKTLLASIGIGLLLAACSPAAPPSEPKPEPKPELAGIEDSIEVTGPLPNTLIASPFTIEGRARGYWYFEASAPVTLKDADGTDLNLNPPYIQAIGEWMTEEFVPFSGSHTFDAPETATGQLILQNDNPSGEAANQKTLTIPVTF